MKPVSYKRVLAYLVDILIITIISSLLTMFIPASDEYTKASEKLTIVMEDYTSGEIEDEEYLEKVNDISYVLNKESLSVSIVTVVITTIYFVVIAYYMNGQTLGKKLMKIKIISTSDSKLSMNKLLLRSLIIDSILLNVISILTILFMSKSLYLKTYDIISTIFGIIYIGIFAMILFRQDGMGLHDIIAKTKVVSFDEKELEGINVKNAEIDDEKVIETKKVDDNKEIKKEKTSRITKTSKKKK